MGSLGSVELVIILVLMAIPIAAVTIATVRYVRTSSRRDSPPT